MVREQQTDGGRSGGSPDTIDAVSVAVVERLAAAKGCDPEVLPPLYRSIDPDALEHLVTRSKGGLSQISFSHAGCDVTVTGDGDVSVSE